MVALHVDGLCETAVAVAESASPCPAKVQPFCWPQEPLCTRRRVLEGFVCVQQGLGI